MIRFNTQIADLVEDLDLCRNIYNGFQLGQSVRHLATKHNISDYAVKKLAHYYRDVIKKKAPQTACDA